MNKEPITDNDYEPFGNEWKKEIRKLRKVDIVDLLAETKKSRLTIFRNQSDSYNNGWNAAIDAAAENAHTCGMYPVLVDKQSILKLKK